MPEITLNISVIVEFVLICLQFLSLSNIPILQTSFFVLSFFITLQGFFKIMKNKHQTTKKIQLKDSSQKKKKILFQRLLCIPGIFHDIHDVYQWSSQLFNPVLYVKCLNLKIVLKLLKRVINIPSLIQTINLLLLCCWDLYHNVLADLFYS